MESKSTHREFTANRPEIVIKNKKENRHTDRCGNICRQKYRAKGSRKADKTQQFTYGDTANVEHEVCHYIGNKWSHRTGNKRLKEMF